MENFIKMLGANDVMLMNLDEYATDEKLIDWMPKKISEEWGLLSMPVAQRPKFIDSGIIVSRNTVNARRFIEKWLEICANRKYAFLTYDSTKDGIKGFTYDQSLLSLAAYKNPNGVLIIPKEKMKQHTVFHHRHPGNNKPLLPFYVLPAKKIREWIGKVFPSFCLVFSY